MARDPRDAVSLPVSIKYHPGGWDRPGVAWFTVEVRMPAEDLNLVNPKFLRSGEGALCIAPGENEVLLKALRKAESEVRNRESVWEVEKKHARHAGADDNATITVATTDQSAAAAATTTTAKPQSNPTGLRKMFRRLKLRFTRKRSRKQ